ncbi:hypothetical protein IG631_08779 [Alternaria alternata]|nr:hypothetical protein IG631_08779 [Alternaria alternata]
MCNSSCDAIGGDSEDTLPPRLCAFARASQHHAPAHSSNGETPPMYRYLCASTSVLMHVLMARCHNVAHGIIPSKDVPGCVLKAPTYSLGSILNWWFTCMVTTIIPMHE